jgi:hypothetical protein
LSSISTDPTAVEYAGRWQGFFQSSVTGEIGTFTLDLAAAHNRQLDGTLRSPTLKMSLPFHVTVGASDVFTAVSPGGNFVVHGRHDAGFIWFEHGDYRLRQGGMTDLGMLNFFNSFPDEGAVQLPSELDGTFVRDDGNPLRPGAMTPYADHGAPVVSRILTSGHLKGLFGRVDLIAETFDRPPLSAPQPAWHGMPVAPVLVRWRLVRNAHAYVPWRTPSDFRTSFVPQIAGKPPRDVHFRNVYAPGTRNRLDGDALVENLARGRSQQRRLRR